jgi:hypothetical protein
VGTTPSSIKTKITIKIVPNMNVLSESVRGFFDSVSMQRLVLRLAC